MSAEVTFRTKAPGIMRTLMEDFPIGAEDAAAVLGNLGAESGGLVVLQEVRPTVAGSRGGYGWAQWTGPRRTAFEAYCSRNGLDPSGDKANYAWLFLELKGTEKHAIAALTTADGLNAKVVAFERAFERAGVKNYEARKRWAAVALDAYRTAPDAPDTIAEVPPTLPPLPAAPVTAAPTPVVVPAPAPVPAPAAVPGAGAPAPMPTPAPAPIGHNGGSPLTAEPVSVHPPTPHPTPVEQASKAVGAGKWTGIVGVLWTGISAALMSMPQVPVQYRDPALLAGIGTLLTTLAAVIGAYVAPPNALPAVLSR